MALGGEELLCEAGNLVDWEYSPVQMDAFVLAKPCSR